MPAGPGKFEGEGFATFALHDLSMVSAQDEEAGTTDTTGWFGLFRGPVTLTPSDEEPDETIASGAAYGYTDEEIAEGIALLSSMVGAILSEDSQGFVSAAVYTDTDALEADWEAILEADTEAEDR